MHWMLFLCGAELLAYFYFRMGKQCFVRSYGNAPCNDSPKVMAEVPPLSCDWPVAANGAESTGFSERRGTAGKF